MQRNVCGRSGRGSRHAHSTSIAEGRLSPIRGRLPILVVVYARMERVCNAGPKARLSSTLIHGVLRGGCTNTTISPTSIAALVRGSCSSDAPTRLNRNCMANMAAFRRFYARRANGLIKPIRRVVALPCQVGRVGASCPNGPRVVVPVIRQDLVVVRSRHGVAAARDVLDGGLKSSFYIRVAVVTPNVLPVRVSTPRHRLFSGHSEDGFFMGILYSP